MTAPASPAPGSRPTPSGPPGFAVIVAAMVLVLPAALVVWIGCAAVLRWSRITRWHLTAGGVVSAGLSVGAMGLSRALSDPLAEVGALVSPYPPSGRPGLFSGSWAGCSLPASPWPSRWAWWPRWSTTPARWWSPRSGRPPNADTASAPKLGPDVELSA